MILNLDFSGNLLFALLVSVTPSLVLANEPVDRSGASEPISPSGWYGEGVRPTEARNPEGERAGFHLAPGFEIRLFAAEPEIAKPMNLAFDPKGRLWVTDSYEYPYPAAGEGPRDSVRILEDTDGDGRADISTVFADQLNIPIGVLPYGDGCLCFSIPNIYYLRDTDGDGRCDQRDIILGPFDTSRDTHGMVNAMRLGSDGWVYANHGFNNQTKIAGSDGHEIAMNSGNTFRFRPDGSRVEHVTWGQVNPFGRTTDDWGYDYTADCHSKPISQLIDGGYYPSFGKPDDGLGFIPSMMEHLHGSTAISGLVFIPESLGLPSLANQMLSGNVMTSRINRNLVTYQGATAKAEELPDFLTSDDPWFRPVDIQLGPDGFLYVADFYNKIIGHYEVPLEHPGRDRFRGRIWQIRPLNPGPKSLTATLESNDMISSWSDSNPKRRSLAIEAAIEKRDQEINRKAQRLLFDSAANENAQISALWYLVRTDGMEHAIFPTLLSSSSAKVRVQALKGIEEVVNRKQMSNEQASELARPALSDASPHVRRGAAAVLGNSAAVTGNTAVNNVTALLNLLSETELTDPVTRQTIRIAIKRLVESGGASRELVASLATSQARELASIMLAIQTSDSAEFLIDYLNQSGASEARKGEMLNHIARYVKTDRLDAAISLAQKFAGDDPETQRQYLDAMIASTSVSSSGGARLAPSLERWLDQLVQRDWETVKDQLNETGKLPLRWSDQTGRGWPLEDRLTEAGDEVALISSFPLGESYTGDLQSEPFRCPELVSFVIAGHNGFPETDDAKRNRIELIEIATGRILYVAYPPRQDAAKTVTWDCRDIASSQVLVRCTDGDNGGSYAWLAFGSLKPQWMGEPTGTVERWLETVRQYRLTSRKQNLSDLIERFAGDQRSQSHVAAILADLNDQRSMARLLLLAAKSGIEAPFVDQWIKAVTAEQKLDVVEQASMLARQFTNQQQRELAKTLVDDRESIAVLVALGEAGSISPEVMLDKNVWDRLAAVADAELLERAEVVRGLAKPVDDAIRTQMDDVVQLLTQQLDDHNTDIQRGRTAYTQHCAICHQIAGQGEVVGPQLDGVGGRGAARLVEDILTPDRNADAAFRTTTLVTVDGTVVNGLVRNENAEQIVIVGQDGKPITVAMDDIELRRQGTTSLMPGNFHETLGTEGVAAVIAYLIEAAPQK